MVECPECHRPIEDGIRFCPYCGSAAAGPTLDPFVGATVNGMFRVEALIGQGGMGRVYRARHLTLDRPVVLKMLHKAYSSDPQIVQRFQREARAASRLNHPNSIAVLDFGEAEDGTLFMAMEYLAGRDLGRVVAEDFPLGEQRIVRIGAQVLSALAEAHAQGIIHRDLKPENVMLEPRRDNPDFVKVLDFGIAKIITPGEGEPKLTQAGLVCGTPEYMSPEQARGADLDARSDLYSMGVLLYQLLTGALPFQSDTPVGFLTAHLSQIPVPPRARRPELSISAAMDALVSRALEKDAGRRYQSADEMRAALLACAGPSAPRVPAARAPRPATEPATVIAAPRRSGLGARPVFWAFVAVMVLAMVGGGAVVYMVRTTSAERRNFARQDPADPKADATGPTGPGASAPGTTAPTGQVQVAPPPPVTGAAATPADGLAGTGSPPTGTEAPAGTTTPDPGTVADPVPTSVVPSGPAQGKALLRKAESRRKAGDVDGAIRLYLAALEADRGLAEAQKKLAVCYQLKGDTRRAAERYRQYLATNPPDADRVRLILGGLE